MTLQQRKKLKLALSLTGALIFFLFFIIFTNTLTRQYSDETVRIATKNVLEQWSGQEVQIHEKIRPAGAGLTFSHRYTVTIGPQQATAYLVTITGRSGPYSTVFCVFDSGIVEFSGFLLYPGRGGVSLTLGITPRMIQNWKQRIATLAVRSGETHE